MSLSSWFWLMAWFAAEITALVAGAAVLQVCFRSPRARRILWQAAFASAALVLIVEFSGLRDRMTGPDLKQRRHFVITATVLPSSGLVSRPDDRAAEIAPAAMPAPSMVKWPGWAWLAGATLFLARALVARIWLGVRRRQAAPAGQDSLQLIADLQKPLGLGSVQSQIWSGLRGPVAFGVFRPTIALPPDFATRFSSAEKRAMLAHEMAHLAAHDPFWLMVSDVVIAVAWWHPLVWWARNKLQIAAEAAADEASALIPGGPCALAECLVRLGRELTAGGPAHLLGVGGSGPRSQLAARIAWLLREPRDWRPSSVWVRWMPHLSAVFVALASAVLPIQTGLSGSILALFAAAVPARAETPPALPASVPVTNQTSVNTSNSLVAVTNMLADVAPLTNIQAASATFTVSATGSAPLSYQWVYNGSNISAEPVFALVTNRVATSNCNSSPPVTMLVASAAVTAKPLPKVSLQVQAVIITEKNSDDIGLDWVFGLVPTNNPGFETSRDSNALKASFVNQTNNHPRNLVVDRLRTEGQSALLQPEQFAALRNRIIARTGGGFIFIPATESISGLQTRLAIGEIDPIVTGVAASDTSPTNAASINYFTDDIGLGLAMDIHSTVEDNDTWRLDVLVSFTTFLGYDDPGKFVVSAMTGGKPITGVFPLPHFRVVEASTKYIVPLGQTLAIRGPLWTETTKTKGRFLMSGKTKTTRQRYYLFVTPTRPPAGSH